ncbi:RNA polymerase sigma-70 factor [Flagellimonas baculiformis]|uniref:RNA polymerase sigma-70 factor n=1 Tax=Flagellimonas baculiformis TaxID=3067310 RepID=UPI00296F1CDE|nr:RNA polymerase sigma-70 factor [Muricauda sp. D6]
MYQKYHRGLHAFAFGLVKSKEMADEILQEVFMTVWINSESLQPDLSFKSYIFTIAKNKALNFLQKVANTNRLRDEIFHKSQVSRNDVEDYLTNSEYTLLRERAIRSLPAKRKLIFEMSREKGMSYDDISRELGISLSTVKNQMSRALSDIKAYLNSHPDISLFVLVALNLSME